MGSHLFPGVPFLYHYTTVTHRYANRAARKNKLKCLVVLIPDVHEEMRIEWRITPEHTIETESDR